MGQGQPSEGPRVSMPATFYPEGAKKPRWMKGESHYCAKLTDEKVREIRASQERNWKAYIAAEIQLQS